MHYSIVSPTYVLQSSVIILWYIIIEPLSFLKWFYYPKIFVLYPRCCHPKALSLVEKATTIQVHFTLEGEGLRAKRNFHGWKVFMDSYMVSWYAGICVNATSKRLGMRGLLAYHVNGTSFGWESRALTCTWSRPLACVWSGPKTPLYLHNSLIMLHECTIQAYES